MIRMQEVSDFVQAALECSIHVSPTDPGLTQAELLEAAKRLNFKDGETLDALPGAAAQMYLGDSRLMPRLVNSQFHLREEPDFRNIAAFDFISTELLEVVRDVGAARARIDRTVLVARAVAKGLPVRAVEAAITIFVLSEHCILEDGTVRFVPGRETYPLASEQARQAARQPVTRKEMRAHVHPVIEDIVSRRTDRRPTSAESLDAFADELSRLGYGNFLLWWQQTVSELRQLDPSRTPVAVAVLAGALVEGSLTFVVKRARDLKLAVFASPDFARPPRTWKIDDLVASAASGRESAVLDAGTRARADELILVRQRIHAGRMLADHPGGVPDLRPEEARQAKATAEAVVRRVIDWLARHAASPPPPKE